MGRGVLEEKGLLPVKQKEGTAGKLVGHSGKLVFKMYGNNERRPVFMKPYAAFQVLDL
jgi:hypothetical protein